MRETASFNAVLLQQTKPVHSNSNHKKIDYSLSLSLCGLEIKSKPYNINWNWNESIEGIPLCGLEASVQHALHKTKLEQGND